MLWVLVALTAAGPVGDALDARSTAVTVLAVVGGWALWAVAFGALLVVRSSALTVVRVLVPAAPLAVGAAAVEAGVDTVGLLAVAVAALATVSVITPWVGEAFVDGSSYGNEQRLLLRPPVVFWFVAPLTWFVVVAGAVAGPFLLVAGRPLAGIVVSVIGWAIVAVGVRSLHQLTRRWLVFVPTGVVLHDHLTMPESQLFPRIVIRHVGAAPVDADADAVDLTAGAAGVVLRLGLKEPIELLVRTGWGRSETLDREAVLICPTRPRRVLEVARERRIPIG